MELQTRVVNQGQDTHSWDNFHQTYKMRVLEPLDKGTNKAGCPECVHVHWRWSAFVGPNYGGGLPILPFGSNQDVDIAVTHYNAGEEHPVDYTPFVNGEVISDWTLIPLPYGYGYPVDDFKPHEVVFWYSATGHQNQDAFFVHGGFFSLSQPNPTMPISEGTNSPVSVQSLFQDGPTSVTYADLFENGATTVALANPNTTPSLPPGYAPFNNLVYDVETDAVVSGPNKVAFAVPTVTDSAVFDNLRILHLEEDSLDPDRLR